MGSGRFDSSAYRSFADLYANGPTCDDINSSNSRTAD